GLTTHRPGPTRRSSDLWISGDGIVNFGIAVHLHVKGVGRAIATDDLLSHGQLGLLLVGDGALLGITGYETDHTGAAIAITTDGSRQVAAADVDSDSEIV